MYGELLTLPTEYYQQGVTKTSMQMIQNLMESGDYTYDVAVKLLRIPEDEWDNYRDLVAQKKIRDLVSRQRSMSPFLLIPKVIDMLKSDFQIQMDDDLKKEIETMCNAVEAILEYGVQQGIPQGKEHGYHIGIEEGRALGVEEGRVLERKNVLLKLMEMDLPFEKALEVLEIPEDEWDNYRNLVAQK